MEKQFDCAMARQARLMPSFGKEMNAILSREHIAAAVPEDKIKKAKKIIVTGCGDSWLAGIATRPAFEKFSGVDMEPWRNIEFTRHMPESKLSDEVIVIGVSISGSVRRVVEAMERAKKHGAVAVVVTDNPDSAAGQAAEHVIHLNMPELEPCAGVCSYVASTLALIAFARHVGMVKGVFCEKGDDEARATIDKYMDDYAKAVDEVEETALKLAHEWKDLVAFDFIGNYADFATAYFGGAKFVEGFGAIVTTDDSEDWCHIPYFIRQPKNVGTSLVIDKDSPSLSRAMENVETMGILERPLAIITDMPKSDLPASATVFSLPACDASWLKPVMMHMPFNFLGGFIAELIGEPNFRHREEAPWNSEVGNTIRTSKMEIL